MAGQVSPVVVHVIELARQIVKGPAGAAADRAAALREQPELVPRRRGHARGAVQPHRRVLVPVGARLQHEPGGVGGDHRAAWRGRRDRPGDAVHRPAVRRRLPSDCPGWCGQPDGESSQSSCRP